MSGSFILIGIILLVVFMFVCLVSPKIGMALVVLYFIVIAYDMGKHSRD